MTAVYAALLCAQVTIEFPIIADPTREISVKYGMLDPGHLDMEGCRSPAEQFSSSVCSPTHHLKFF